MAYSINIPLYRHFFGWTYRFYLALLPSYLRARLDGTDTEPKATQRTTYLDGLRGIASFLVFLRHFLLPWLPNLDHGFGQGPGNNNVLQLPIIRILYSGPNVPLFLVVSGYVMALKPIKYARQREFEAFRNSLVSSIFRRALRIFPPPIFSTFIVMLLAQAGFFSYPYASIPGHIPSHPHLSLKFSQQFMSWFNFAFYELTNPWTWKTKLPLLYGAHLWTIPLQFRCSMVLFITIMGLSNLRVQPRAFILLLLTIFSLSHDQWPVALYLSGMGMAEYDLIQQEKTESLAPTSLGTSRKSNYTRYLSILTPLLLAGFGLYFSSFPRFRGNTAALGYWWVTSMESYYELWHACGAILLVWSLGHFKSVQWLFTTQWARYLGKLSFSLYIVHEPLLHILAFRTVDLVWRLTGNDTSFKYYSGIALSFFMITPVLLWLADLFYCWIDEPCGKMAQSVERKYKCT